ncbi:MAG: GMC oxidoreductase [Isosphaeraceae bacterium]
MVLVVGSGPAGVSGAKALLRQGRRVTMIDVGLNLEPARRALLDRIASREVEAWDPIEVAALKGHQPHDARGIQVKLAFGSDYPYRSATESLGLSIPDGTFKPSFARGGLSTVWGASAMPYNAHDLERWPITEQDLAPHYRAVGEWMPMAAGADDLAADHPHGSDSLDPPLPSNQARALLDRMNRSRDRLRRAGIRFGHSRIALRSRDCRRCGLCLYGCPYRLIYNASDTVDEMLSDPRFSYVPGVRVERLREGGGRVLVEGVDVSTGARCDFTGERCFLAAGIVATARIVLESSASYDRELEVIDSQYTLLPLAAMRTTPDITMERLHTLCQLYLEVDDPRISRHNMHCQLYTYSDLFHNMFASLLFGLPARLPFVERQILSRLMVALCYLHSDESSGLRIALSRPTNGKPGDLNVRFAINPCTQPTVLALARKLLRHSGDLGFVPLLPLINLAHPGRSYHSGGSFPMSHRPEGFRSDTLGRPLGWERIHLVDASVFPTIPAATITYTVMANAHRIATSA